MTPENEVKIRALVKEFELPDNFADALVKEIDKEAERLAYYRIIQEIATNANHEAKP